MKEIKGRHVSSFCFVALTGALIWQTFIGNSMLVSVYQIVAPTFIGAIALAGGAKGIGNSMANSRKGESDDKTGK